VSEINGSDINKAFGGDEESGYLKMYSFRSTSNAYMLMYRQSKCPNTDLVSVNHFHCIVDASRNHKSVPSSEIPEVTVDLVNKEIDLAAKKKENEAREREMVKLKVRILYII
jgi:hypothetical protein